MLNEDRLKLLEILNYYGAGRVLKFIAEYVAEKTCSFNLGNEEKLRSRDSYKSEFEVNINWFFEERM